MKYMIFRMIILLFFLSTACDEKNNDNPVPTPMPTPIPTPLPTPSPDCIDVLGDFGPLEPFTECPTEGIILTCNTLFCDFFDHEQNLVMQPFVLPFTCEALDCFTMTCDLRSTEFTTMNEIIGVGTLSIEDFLTPEVLIGGGASIDGQPGFIYDCNIAVP